jgi:hypothetical protein
LNPASRGFADAEKDRSDEGKRITRGIVSPSRCGSAPKAGGWREGRPAFLRTASTHRKGFDKIRIAADGGAKGLYKKEKPYLADAGYGFIGLCLTEDVLVVVAFNAFQIGV